MTESKASNILNTLLAEESASGVLKSIPCLYRLTFLDGQNGYQKAKSAGLITHNEGNGLPFIAAVLPNGDRLGLYEIVSPPQIIWERSNSCFAIESIEVTTIANIMDNFKEVDFAEKVKLPPELDKLKPYLWTTYSGKLTFQKTDHGWRVQKLD